MIFFQFTVVFLMHIAVSTTIMIRSMVKHFLRDGVLASYTCATYLELETRPLRAHFTVVFFAPHHYLFKVVGPGIPNLKFPERISVNPIANSPKRNNVLPSAL